MYGEATGGINILPGSVYPNRSNVAVESRPLLTEALDAVQGAVKEVHDLANMVKAHADSVVGSRLESTSPGNGGGIPPMPSGRGHELLAHCNHLRDALAALRSEVQRLNTV